MGWIEDKEELHGPDFMKLERFVYLREQGEIQVPIPKETPMSKLLKAVEEYYGTIKKSNSNIRKRK